MALATLTISLSNDSHMQVSEETGSWEKVSYNRPPKASGIAIEITLSC